MFLRSIIILLSLVFVTNIHAQTGKLSGKVVNDKNEPLAGVSVNIEGSGGSTTNTDGRFEFTLTTGKKYIVGFTTVGYAAQTLETEILSATTAELLVMMQTASKDLGGVVVTSRSSARRETVNSLIAFQKNTNTVAQVVSAEAIRRSPDRSTGEILKRVPGTSVQDGKYLIVRGLSDRYNQAMLNGILLTSTEADRKTFSFDLFPASVIDNIIINKAFVPELPGEWAGGLVQVNTKDIPSRGFLNIQIGTGFNTQTVGKDFYRYQGGKLDWLGFDDGSRRLPDAIPLRAKFEQATPALKNQYGSTLNNNWVAERGSAPMNTSFQLNSGFNTTVLNKKVGGIFSLNYNRSNRRLPFSNVFQTVQNNIASVILDYANERYSQDVLWGALGNLTVQLNSKNKISVKNLFNVNGSDYATLRNGAEYSNGTDSIRGTEFGFKSTIYNNTQLIGEHSLPGNTKLKWYGGFTVLDQYTPDQRRLLYTRNFTTNEPYRALISDVLSQRSANRFFSNLNDYIYNGGADVAKSFQWGGFNQTIKAGYMFQVRDRLFDARPFSIYLPKSNSSNNALKELPPDQIFLPGNFDADDDLKFGFDQLSNIKFRYMANNILNAGYLQFDNQFSDVIRLVWGVRAEHFDQLVGSVYKSDPRHFNTKQLDFLPGVNLTLKLNDKTNLRLSGSQTVIRPELRELVEYEYYDFDLNASVRGLPNLQRTKVTNADLRYEIYPRAGEMFTIGAFYKHFKTPIELQFNLQAGGASSYNYLNAPKADALGVELEGRKKLDFIGGLKNFTAFGNLSYIYNRVKFENDDLSRPMQGQSPYIINIGMQYDLEKAGVATTLLFNQIGRRILYVGGQDAPAIWEQPRPLLDFQVAKKILREKAELRLNITDLLNRENFLYYDVNENEKFERNGDGIFINRRMGTTFSLSFLYHFKK